jgi:aspartyl-tRNA synthetase
MIGMERTHYVNEAKKAGEGKITIAGWVNDVRDLGKLKFVHVRDITGVMQVTMKKGIVPDELLESVDLNREDVVSFTGILQDNKMAPDGMELIPESFKLFSKVEKKLPVDPSGNVESELETRLDYRYIDLRKKDISTIFRAKSVIARAFREKMEELKFTEIHPSAISGAATEGGTDVFPIQYFENKAFLVQSPQLYKQLAVVGGFDRVTMTVPVFRAEKHNTVSHLNEIVQMDMEMGFADHNDAMDILEKTFLHMLGRVKERLGPDLEEIGTEVKIPTEVPRYKHKDLVKKLQDSGFEIGDRDDFSKEAEKKLHELLGHELYFIYDWPTEVRAFYSMPDKEDEGICHAFDMMYKGLELASGAKRIHIPSVLEEQLRKRGLDPANFDFYINAFRMGAPPHAGWSIGLERATMQICGLNNIREAMLFPRDRTRIHP